MLKKILSLVVAGFFVAGVSIDVQAMTRDAIAAVKVSKSGKFNYRSKNSQAKSKLVEYVKDITNKKSSNFIPVEDRVAVFDLDGTLICETAPYYFDQMVILERAFNDPTFKFANDIDREVAELINKKIYSPSSDARKKIESARCAGQYIML